MKRLLEKRIKYLLKHYPAVALLGARQTGKTTLAKKLSKHYFDLEIEADKLRLDVRWHDIIKSSELIILDEAQEMPDVFPRLRSAIDQKRKKNGRFLLLGSVSPALMHHVSDSLAGRLALCELTPVTITELKYNKINDLWLRGGYPDGGILKSFQFGEWQKNYLTLLAQRDLPNWGLSAKPQLTLRFFAMLAHFHGQIWNASKLGSSLGISYHTVRSYLEFLSNSFLIRILPPYHLNLKKRLVKSPKIYWRDSGVLHSHWLVNSYKKLLEQPNVGASYEGFVIQQVLATLESIGLRHNAFYFRTSDGIEIDLVIEVEQELWAIEIKLTTNVNQESLAQLRTKSKLIRATHSFLISQSSSIVQNDTEMLTNISYFIKWILKRTK